MAIPEGGAPSSARSSKRRGARNFLQERKKAARRFNWIWTASEPGVHMVRVYRGERLLAEMEVEFVE
jgi:hypothetical protein